MTIVNLVKPNPNSELIRTLKELLERAENGSVVGLVGVTLRPDQTFGVTRVGDCSDLELAGALSFAQHDLMISNKAGQE